MLVDANILVFAVDLESSFHARAEAWLTDQLNGNRRVGLPWESIAAFLRLITNPRVTRDPLPATDAWSFVDDWLSVPIVWVPAPTEDHARVLGSLMRTYQLTGNAIPDAHLAAIAVEHGLEVCSADTDFARFREVRWRNPLG
jgi:toxin-antitoxin system PIN domain toxin